jgi:hypothetical protein
MHQARSWLERTSDIDDEVIDCLRRAYEAKA